MNLSIIQPDDWHVHLREHGMLDSVIQHTSKVFKRCIAMPNLEQPITHWQMAAKYKNIIESNSQANKLQAFIPCYLTDNIEVQNLKTGINNKSFVGAKLYPLNATTNSAMGISRLEKIYKALETLEECNAPLLVHGEKINDDIDIFDREKYFIDDELSKIIKYFPNLKIVLEHVSSSYGADFVASASKNIACTVTLHHLMLTKKDVFNGDVNPHHLCMPVVKEEKDLISLRKYACSGNAKFFLGTDSAPHNIIEKENTENIKPGIYTSPVAIEMYATIFEEENSLDNFEKFTSINGPDFYNLPYNTNKLILKKHEWVNPEFTTNRKLKIKNFLGGKIIQWQSSQFVV